MTNTDKYPFSHFFIFNGHLNFRHGDSCFRIFIQHPFNELPQLVAYHRPERLQINKKVIKAKKKILSANVFTQEAKTKNIILACIIVINSTCVSAHFHTHTYIHIYICVCIL